MKSFQVADFNAPLKEVDQPTPQPSGTQVLIKVKAAGVCHSDLHIWEGGYDLGHGRKPLSLKDRGVSLPRTMGHETVGEVLAFGPDARAETGGLKVGDVALVYPWLGCGKCETCLAGDENMCLKPNSLGVYCDGGYADHMTVPHPRYLLNLQGLDPVTAAPYACSGVTTYSAIKKVEANLNSPIVIFGAGGLGLMALSLLKAMGGKGAIVVDIDAGKREAAMKAGALATVDGKAPDALEQLAKAAGGPIRAVIDLVGNAATTQLGFDCLSKGGKLVIVGLFGGGAPWALPLIPIKAITIQGSYVGNLRETQELLDLVRAKKIGPIPVTPMPLAKANEALILLQQGKLVGRAVLTPYRSVVTTVIARSEATKQSILVLPPDGLLRFARNDDQIRDLFSNLQGTPMSANNALHIAVLGGDGIGPEVMAPALEVLRKIEATTDLKFRFTDAPAGANNYLATGKSMPESTVRLCEEADAILLGACGLPSVRYPDNTEIAPQIELRFHFDLYAGVRPARLIPGVPSPIVGADQRGIDLVLIRESTEGLFASMGKGVVTDTEARETLVITRKTSERLFEFSFRLAERRKARGRSNGGLTCVDKANVFRAFAFFRGMFDEAAGRHPDVKADRLYVDACSLMLVKRPWDFDVMVTENMFGDILSDLAAGLIGGLGMAPSADISDRHAVFQPCHGTAPDIMGQGKANPTGMILSAAMMLDWLADRHGLEAAAEAGERIERAVDKVYAEGIKPMEFGGSNGTADIAKAVLAAL